MNTPVQMAFTGLRNVAVTDEDVQLGNGFSLVKPNEFLFSARSRFLMNDIEFEDAGCVSCFLIYRSDAAAWKSIDGEKLVDALQNGLMAFQIIKPVETLGFLFCGWDTGGSAFSLQGTQDRGPMDAGAWPRLRRFDRPLLDRVPEMICKVQKVMAGTSTEKKNGVVLLQLGLESRHPLIAGLLWTMGIDAILDSEDKFDFKKKLCNCLGTKTLVFPDWVADTAPPTYTVEDVAIDLYMLRSKVAHGDDLREAATNKKTPVDLLKKVHFPNSTEPLSYSLVLSQAACLLLCQVLQKTLE